jgi:hypothetical protein
MATNQPIAAGVSAKAPLSGQDNRSGKNFQFLTVPGSGSITASLPASITCAVMKDVSGGRDPVITTVSNGSSFDASKVNASDNYYLASPSGATLNFEVTFSGNV